MYRILHIITGEFVYELHGYHRLQSYYPEYVENVFSVGSHYHYNFKPYIVEGSKEYVKSIINVMGWKSSVTIMDVTMQEDINLAEFDIVQINEL